MERDNAEIEKLFDELKVFKDCSMREFIAIFGGFKINNSLPLFANLYVWRQCVEFHNYFEAYTSGLCAPFIYFANFICYSFLVSNPNASLVKFASLRRSIGLYLIYQGIKIKYYPTKHLVDDY